MRTKQVSLTLPIMLAICLCFTASAQQAGRIESMKLLTPDVGWAATGKKLFWTTDGGAQWRDITPKLDHKEQRVSSVFFLDASTGWALLSCSDGRDPIADDVCFEFASTTNAGENWSVVHPKTVDPVPQSVITEDGQGFSGKTFLDFADAQHGWAILKRNLHVEASSGEMLRTVDGGHTWTQLPHDSLPMADRFCFVSTKDGWIAGGPDQELYRTHDAGDRWQLVSLAAPAQISKDMSPVYDLPVFVGEKTGYLQATNESSMSSGVPVVVFKTEDGGGTWHPLITTGTQPDAHPWTAYPSAIANGELLTATVSGGRIELSHTEQGAEAKHQSARIPVHASTVDQLSFVSPLRGWILATYWILSTSDGGASWMNVTPDPTGTVPSLASSDLAPSGGTHNRPTASPEGSAAVLPGAGNISTHLGFDTFPTQPTATMLAWSTSSPYYDAYVYLYGSPNKSTVKSKYPTKSWVSTTEGYGWGIIPIWFGLQSSCIINQPQVTQYFGPTVAEASDQGAEQADQAVTAAQTLGLPAGIIYTDIENYTVNSTCSPLVQAYVDAWVTEIHVYSGYIAGIYANPGPIKSDIHNQSVAPADVIWVTKVNSPPQVTIWNQGINDSWWPNSQRTHQFLLNQAATFAGVGPINIDPDIDNAPVLNANAVAKTYTYGTPTNISCPGAINTYPTAINDMSDGTFISGSGQIGTVVGTFQAALGSPYYGFQNTGGSCTTISIQGAASVEATGINNLGQIVGYFEGSDGLSRFSAEAWRGPQPSRL